MHTYTLFRRRLFDILCINWVWICGLRLSFLSSFSRFDINLRKKNYLEKKVHKNAFVSFLFDSLLLDSRKFVDSFFRVSVAVFFFTSHSYRHFLTQFFDRPGSRQHKTRSNFRLFRFPKVFVLHKNIYYHAIYSSGQMF